ncbi:ubiquitin-conjugating enzyme E2 J1-like [Ciona intestinalis]
MQQSYNLRSPAVKRLMREAQELAAPTYEYSAKPLDDNLFEWHFTFRGPKDSDFDGGLYHGRIILPPEYPMKPPSIMLLNANGRFELNKKICLSISGYHPESWQPSWSIRTAILAIIGFMPTKGEGAIGALDYTAEERKILARRSKSYSCTACGCIRDLLPSESEGVTCTTSDAENRDKELAKQITFGKPKAEKKEDASKSEETSNAAPIDPNVTSQENDPNTTSENLENPSVENDVSPAQDDGVRKRSTVTTPPPPATAPLPRSETNQSSDSSTMLIVLLAIAIALLFLRRINRMYNLSSMVTDYL